MPVNKTNKANDAKRKAEALKAKKKTDRDSRAKVAANISVKPGEKGPSIVSQSKGKKK